MTVGSGQSTLSEGSFSDVGVTSFSAGSQTTIGGPTSLVNGATVRLNGTTTWSAGNVTGLHPSLVPPIVLVAAPPAEKK